MHPFVSTLQPQTAKSDQTAIKQTWLGLILVNPCTDSGEDGLAKIPHLLVDELADNLALTGVDESARLYHLRRRTVVIAPPPAKAPAPSEPAAATAKSAGVFG